ncbi:MAG: RluA family pseudouridine synthase [Spirochaetes bacterium]|nr:RluA family pseudouridine synthase [Spirochaetota bacterium]
MFRVGGSDEGKRLDLFLSERLEKAGISRSLVRRYIDREDGLVLVNAVGKKAHHRVKAGDSIEITIPAPEPSTLLPLDLALDVIYEDEDILVINKPAGVPTHPSHGHENDTIVNALLSYFKGKGTLSSIGGEKRPGIVHRLDKDTSGLLVIAKNDSAHTCISREFANKAVFKVYEAIVKGDVLPKKGVIERPIKRSERNRKKYKTGENGKMAETAYEVIDTRNDTSWVRFMPATGRTHQIRVHSASIGHPIMGDVLYARKSSPVEYMALVARRIEFTHPKSGRRMRFLAPYPPHFVTLCEILGYVLDDG